MSNKGRYPLKFAFSTLGCPGWTIEQAIEAAKDLGYDGIELRLLDGEVIDPIKDIGKVMRAVLLCRASGIEVFKTSGRYHTTGQLTAGCHHLGYLSYLSSR